MTMDFLYLETKESYREIDFIKKGNNCSVKIEFLKKLALIFENRERLIWNYIYAFI